MRCKSPLGLPSSLRTSRVSSPYFFPPISMAVITHESETGSSMAVLVAIIAVIAIAAIAFLLMNNQAALNTTPDTNVTVPDVNIQNPLPEGDGVPLNNQ